MGDCLVRFALDFAGVLEMSADVLDAISLEDGPVEPRDEAKAGNDSDEDEPEPDEDVDLLVEEIDGEDTLDVEVVNSSKTTHFESAHRNPRKSSGRTPIRSSGQFM